MAVDLSYESKRTSRKFHVVSEIDYKIILLEKIEPLSTIENNRLESLRQQKAIKEKLGMNTLKTKKVPAIWVDSVFKSTEKAKSKLELEEVEERVMGAVAENMRQKVT